MMKCFEPYVWLYEFRYLPCLNDIICVDLTLIGWVSSLESIPSLKRILVSFVDECS